MDIVSPKINTDNVESDFTKYIVNKYINKKES